MENKQCALARVLSILDEDAALVLWFLELAARTPDVYVKPLATVSPSTHLRDELGIDSIGRLCVFYELVDALGLQEEEVEDATAAGWTTVGDVLGFVRARVRP